MAEMYLYCCSYVTLR